MKLPLEVLDALNWRDSVPSAAAKQADPEAEAGVDRFIVTKYPVFGYLVQFGVDYHWFMDKKDPAGLAAFIEKYKGDSYGKLATFAKGLEKDIDAVTNALLRPDISNGPVEGKNSSIKCDKRVYGGRAKVDLLTAKSLLRQSFLPARGDL